MSRRLLKRIPLEKLMDLKIDYAFKQLFGSEKNKEITVVFLNAILKRTDRNTIKEITFIQDEANREHETDKLSKLDIVVRTQKDELINVEMQVSNQNNMMKRTLYYWSRLFGKQLDSGEAYHDLLPTITINICNFDLFDTPHYHSTYHLYDDQTKQRLKWEDDMLEIHFIEMKKFIKLWYADQLNALDDILIRWLLLLGMVDARKQKVYDDIYKELEELAMKDDQLREAFGAWEYLSQTKDEMIAYESRVKAIKDEESAYKYARDKGIEEGMEKGMEEGNRQGKKETAKNLLKMGTDIVKVQEATGLSDSEIGKIVEDLRND